MYHFFYRVVSHDHCLIFIQNPVDTDDENMSSTDDDMEGSFENEDESNDPEYVPPNEDEMDAEDPYPGVEKKREIIAHWMLSDDRRRKWPSMTNRYSKLAKYSANVGHRMLRKWRTAVEEKSECIFVNMCAYSA